MKNQNILDKIAKQIADIKKFFLTLLQDRDGNTSSKRAVGVGSFVCLAFAWYLNQAHGLKVDEVFVYTFASLIFACLGLTIPEWFGKK